MAAEAGMKISQNFYRHMDEFSIDKFEALVRAEERKACAKVCEDAIKTLQIETSEDIAYANAVADCVVAIQARENT